MANTKNKENAPRGFHVILHLCCFAGQHSASLFSKCSHPLPPHCSYVTSVCCQLAAVLRVAADVLPLRFMIQSKGWLERSASFFLQPLLFLLLLPLLGTRGQHRGQLLSVTRKPPPAVGLSNASRTARSRAHSEHMRLCYLRDFVSFLFLTSKRRM